MAIWSVVDTETTGISSNHYAISIGTLIADIDQKQNSIECIDSMYSLIQIPDPSMAELTKWIHGISTKQVSTAPLPSDVCNEYLKLKRKHRFKYAAAWNHPFDRRFIEKMFNMAEMNAPALIWKELQPIPFAKLDRHACNLNCNAIRNLKGHNALNDCARALGVYAEYNDYNLDVTSLKKALKANQ